MSQTEGVEEMRSWSQETCRRELHTALPKLRSMFQGSDSWEEMIRLFKIVTEVLLPHISLEEVEHGVFSQLLPKAVKEFHNITVEISRLSSEFSSQNTELKISLRNILQNMAHWLEALTACVRDVCSAENPVALENVHSLPTSVLQILVTTFTHCKESDSLYSGRLHLVLDLLQAIFKEAVCLQKQLMELLDKATLGSSASDVACMVSLLHTFLDICTIVSKMDHALHANTWKFIIKQSIKHQALVESQVRHRDIVSSLCDDILVSFQSCLQIAEHVKVTGIQENTDQRLFQKNLKLCRFFVNSLLHYIKEFMPFLSESCAHLHYLYLQIYSMFPPSLYAVPISDIHQDEIANVFLVAIDLLIVQLLSFRPFMDSVLNESQELPREQQFPKCLLLINILDKLPTLPEDVQILWCSSNKPPEEKQRMPIFKAVFQSFALCSPEISFPVNMKETFANAQSTVNISFYQYTCIHLCAFIVLLPPVCFSELECSLLNAVISYRMMESLLAIDVWCFLARYGTTDLCAHHITVIANLVKYCPGKSSQLSHLIVLLRRLLFLLDTDYQNVSLSALLMACRSSGRLLDSEQHSDVAVIIVQLVPLFFQNQVSGHPLLQETFCLFLDLFSYIARKTEPAKLIQVVSLIPSLCQEDSPAQIKLSVLDFLSSLANILIPQEAQIMVLPKIAGLFSMFLSDPVWLVNQHALETFTRFAEETSYEEIVTQSMNSEDIKNRVISILNKAVAFVEPINRRQERLEEEKSILEKKISHCVQKREEFLSLEPCRKRSRKDSLSRDEEYEMHIHSAEKSLIAVQALIKESHIPAWLQKKLDSIHNLLTKLQHSCQQHP
ncbi:FIGNL1-interacting regulator of recombination and mitosis isoform X3 [Aquarana catesbeiana]|uniref:FIGNL1-interacting regulator of recombination and mitosis isoform X3 n=1 Tax=Aquarana catesbeiana TaxID=8400 RepID=UPI003CCA090B